MGELRTLRHLFLTTLQTRLEYRVDLMLGLAGSLGMQAASLGLLWVVLQTRHDLTGWQPNEIGCLYALTSMVLGCSELFFNGIWWAPTYVQRGQFDRLLVYPARNLPFFLLLSPELHALGNLCGGFVLLLYFGHQAALPLWGLAGLPLWIACGSLIHTAILVMAGSVSIRSRGGHYQLYWLTNTLLQNSRFPITIYPFLIQGLLLVLLPLGLANFVPISALTGRLPLWIALVAPPAAAAIMVSLAWWAWDKAFEGYESTGS